MNRITRNIAIVIVLLINIGCDQISKDYVRNKVADYETIHLIKNYFVLTKVENTGAFLSFGSSLPYSVKFFILAILPLFVLSYGLVYLFTRRHLTTISALALAFGIGGGIGNIYDRIIHGSVTDFLHIDLGFIQTGIFNMADVSITFGLLLFFAQSYLKRNKLI